MNCLILLRLIVAYGVGVINRQNVGKWVCEFKDRRTSPSAIMKTSQGSQLSDEFIVKVEERTLLFVQTEFVMNYTVCALKCHSA